jgi:hypothetical protein
MELDGVVLPPVLVDQPTVPMALVLYLDAFSELDSERAHGTSLARIPWSAIVRYAMFYGMDVDETLFFVRKLDDAHLEHLSKDMGGGDGGSAGTRTPVQRPPRPD